jgi:beta-glucosidase-like glycosyl hydrolase
MKKAVLKDVCMVTVLLMLTAFLTVTNIAQSEASPQPGSAGITRDIAAESVVLLENRDSKIDETRKTLPFVRDEEVSIFGIGQTETFLSGYGSGALVNAPYKQNYLNGMRDSPSIKVNEDVAKVYEAWNQVHPQPQGSWGQWPTNLEEMPITDRLIEIAKQTSRTALYVISRSAGEDRESSNSKGSFLLTDQERTILDQLTQNFDDVVVVLNTGNIIDMSWVASYGDKIGAILYAWQGGEEGGSALADVLDGNKSPSGKLPDTIATSIDDYPSTPNFGNATANNYQEDIYVGYRYFSTFARDKIVYPFGYGLSYTNFDIQTVDAQEHDNKIYLSVQVTNTGAVSGKEVVQVYYRPPQNGLSKANMNLVAFEKTNMLAPGKSETLQIEYSVDKMASFNDSPDDDRQDWVLEKGEYGVLLGNSLTDAMDRQAVFNYYQNTEQTTEQTYNALGLENGQTFNRFTNDNGTLSKDKEHIPATTVDLKARIEANRPQPIEPDSTAEGSVLQDVSSGKITLDQFIAALTPAQLSQLTAGSKIGMNDPNGFDGNTSIIGGVTDELRHLGIPAISTSDGPSGIRAHQEATLIPIATALAATFNPALVNEMYSNISAELNDDGSDALLAPAVNIHRNPLCGRNFEYFSEDPLLSGVMGAAAVAGIQKNGASATLKHFALNSQETGRNEEDSKASQRALREIYLKPFEIVVKSAHPRSVMSAYNKVNGTFAYYNYDLTNTILRKDWGFDGLVMTDWWIKPGKSPLFDGLHDNGWRVQAGSDVLMPGDMTDQDDPMSSFANGSLHLSELQVAAKNVLKFVLESKTYTEKYGLPAPTTNSDPSYSFKATKPERRQPRVDAIYVDGKPVTYLSPRTYQVVELGAWSGDVRPIVTATAQDYVHLDIKQAPSKEDAVALIRASTDEGDYIIYSVTLSSKDNSAYLESYNHDDLVTQVKIGDNSVDGFYGGKRHYVLNLTEDEYSEPLVAKTSKGISYMVSKGEDQPLALEQYDIFKNAGYDDEVRLVLNGENYRPDAYLGVIKLHAYSFDIATDYYFDIKDIAKVEHYDSDPSSSKVISLPEEKISDIKPVQDAFYASTNFETRELSDGSLAISKVKDKTYYVFNIYCDHGQDFWVTPEVSDAHSVNSVSQLQFEAYVQGSEVDYTKIDRYALDSNRANFSMRGGTGDEDLFKYLTPQNLHLDPGMNKVVFNVITGGFNLRSIKFIPRTGDHIDKPTVWRPEDFKLIADIFDLHDFSDSSRISFTDQLIDYYIRLALAFLLTAAVVSFGAWRVRVRKKPKDGTVSGVFVSFLALCRESISKRYQLDPRDKPKDDMGRQV